jgi:hypothetical protein
MPELDGTTTQSGISYQNLYAALRIAEMLSGQDLPATSKITGVRVEAPVNVDDVVVTYEDGHRDYIQAKENLSATGKTWDKIWSQFLREYEEHDFDRQNSRLILCVGCENKENFVLLEEMFESVEGRQNLIEWLSRLRKNVKLWELWTGKIEKLFDKGKPLESLISDSGDSDADNPDSHASARKWALLRCVRVQVRSRELLQRKAIVSLPSSQNDNGLIRPHTLHSTLCKYISDDARNRVEHTYASLSERLESDHRIRLYAAPPLAQLLYAVSSCSATLRAQRAEFGSLAESHIERPVAEEIVEWMLTTGDPQKNIAVLLDGPGRGKTVILRDVLAKLEEQNIITLAIKADRQLTDLSPGRHLHECHGVALPAPVEDVVRWAARSQTKPIVVLLDQVDALSLSMTREPYALEVIARVIARLQGLHNVRVLLSCRTFDLNTTPTLRDLDIQQKFEIPDLSKDEISKVLDKVGVRYQDLAPPAQKLLQVPLHLDLFARVIERQQEKGTVTTQLRNVRTLQDLYHIIWERSVLSPEAPVSSQDRTEVIQRIVLQMEKDERTSAPFFIFDDADSKHLKSAVLFLESQGILQKENTGSNWNFLHQTFYDYAYARFFVASGQSLSQKIFSSSQGLTERPLLQHVLGFLRSTNPQEYERELIALGIDELFENPNLRKHLRHLLRQWFGTLPQPNEIEWNRVRRMLRNSELRVKFLYAAGGNEGWFSRLTEEHIPRWLREIESGRLDNANINALFWFLLSVADSTSAQPQITAFLTPYLGRSEQWDNLLTAWVGRIRQWHSLEAVRLYEKLLLKNWENNDSLFVYHLRDVATQHPLEGCLIVEQMLAQAELPDEPDNHFLWANTFWNAFADRESGGLKIDDKVLETLAEAKPNEFLKSIWPFLERVLHVSALSEENDLSFPTDAFRDTWSIRSTRGVLHRHHFGFALSQTIGKALKFLADTDASRCQEWLNRLEALHYETPQMLVLDVYAEHPQAFSDRALSFLCGDVRRLELGESQCETRRLMREVAPFWSPPQCAEMEHHILAHDRLPHYLRLRQLSLYILQRRGVEQWGLLLALGRERLTLQGQRRLREWDDKFRGEKLPDKPITGVSGFVGPPIEDSKAQKMSDQAWLRAMAHYQGDIKHRREFLKGGAEQLCRVLQGCVKEQPERFAKLFLEKAPLNVDAFYVRALLEGLAESSALSELLFDAVRRFQHHNGPDVYGELPRTIADVLDKRADGGLPSDLMDLMQSWVDNTPPGRFDESYYAQQLNKKIAQLEPGEGNVSES